MNEPIGLKQRLNGYSAGYLDAAGAGTAAVIALRPARSTQEFAETYRHFTLGTPWFHEAWYEAYDNPDLARLYVQGPREHAKTSTVLTYAIRRLGEDHHLRVGIVSGTDGLAMKFLNELKYEFTTNADLLRDYGTCKRCTGEAAHETGPAFAGETWTQHELVLREPSRAQTPVRVVPGMR